MLKTNMLGSFKFMVALLHFSSAALLPPNTHISSQSMDTFPLQSHDNNAVLPPAVADPALPVFNLTDIHAYEWPSTPFIYKVDDDLSLNISSLGILAADKNQMKEFFHSLNAIYYSIAMYKEDSSMITLPFHRWNRNVSVRFEPGLVNALKRRQMRLIVGSVYFLMVDNWPREILWSKVIVGGVPIATFYLYLPGSHTQGDATE